MGRGGVFGLPADHRGTAEPATDPRPGRLQRAGAALEPGDPARAGTVQALRRHDSAADLLRPGTEPMVFRDGLLVLRALRGACSAGERRHAADPILERLVLTRVAGCAETDASTKKSRNRCSGLDLAWERWHMPTRSCNTCVNSHILLAMGAGHDHTNTGTPAPRPAFATALLGGFFIVELTTALLTGSIALLADAGHILTDVAATFMGLCAVILAQRGSKSPGRTYGWHRAEVFTAVANAVLLIGVATIILREAIGRIGHAPEVPGLPMVVVALTGLV